MRNVRGYSVVEVLVGIGILLILGSLFVAGYTKYLPVAAKARCLANMRGLHVAFQGYVEDNNMWPQQPDQLNDDDKLYDNFWIACLRPYTDTEKVWLCPVLEKAKLKGVQGDLLKVHYLPTMFDANPRSMYRWPKQPWLIEMANAHGAGGHILFPDGSIRTIHDVVDRVR